MVGHLTPIIWPQNLLMVVIALHDLSQSGITAVKAIKCYSCANDFIVWHWRHFFLKRNYGITVSDQNCVKPDYTPEMSHLCPSTCFIMYLNGTNRHNGIISTLGTFLMSLKLFFYQISKFFWAFMFGKNFPWKISPAFLPPLNKLLS